jgi:glycogen debranching enzyme
MTSTEVFAVPQLTSIATATISTIGMSGRETTIVSPRSHTPRSSKWTRSFCEKMYTKALEIAQQKVRGGNDAPFFKKRYLDAAFSHNIFLWDTAFMSAFAKYHVQQLPIEQALDNFYGLQEEDGYICREYYETGRPYWHKSHPVSQNPPLLSFAELEVYGQTKDKIRLRRVYPHLVKNFDFLVRQYQVVGNDDDFLFFSDALGSGMDNLPRWPKDWTDDKLGIVGCTENLPGDNYSHEYLKSHHSLWNQQGRSVDFTSQMALFCLNLAEIASELGLAQDVDRFMKKHREIKEAVNKHCWSEDHGFYFDLGHGKQIRRFHVGMYWALLGQVVPPERLDRFVSHLRDPKKFKREVMVPTLAADEAEYNTLGGYWLGAVWAPTSYMVIRGCEAVGKKDLAREIAHNFYDAVAKVYQNTDTFWENYSADVAQPGNPSKPHFCGWTAIAPIAIYREYIQKELTD